MMKLKTDGVGVTAAVTLAVQRLQSAQGQLPERRPLAGQ